MSGGIAQLVALGAQDVHLVGEPQVSFFRSAFKRYTNFSQVKSRQLIQGNPVDGGMSTVRFERKGDLLGATYLVAKNAGVVQNDIANRINKVELLIGGQIIDTQEKEYSTNIWRNFEGSQAKATAPTTFYPLHFFFCDNSTLALPLVALQYHDVEIRIYWSSGVVAGDSFECWSNFIYLDQAEREHFANSPRNMLIKQVQSVPASNEPAMDLTFNHPVAYIACDAANPLDGGNVLSDTVQFKINGTDVGELMEIEPHYSLTPLYYNSAVGPAEPKFGIAFAMDLAAAQPSGSLNFSRLDSARLLAGDSARKFNKKFYAVNYNVLKIENGLGGLLYSN